MSNLRNLEERTEISEKLLWRRRMGVELKAKSGPNPRRSGRAIPYIKMTAKESRPFHWKTTFFSDARFCMWSMMNSNPAFLNNMNYRDSQDLTKTGYYREWMTSVWRVFNECTSSYNECITSEWAIVVASF